MIATATTVQERRSSELTKYHDGGFLHQLVRFEIVDEGGPAVRQTGEIVEPPASKARPPLRVPLAAARRRQARQQPQQPQQPHNINTASSNKEDDDYTLEMVYLQTV